VTEDDDHRYRAVQSRDPRFDGWFFTAVTSTGIYCRPSCPARTPDRRNVRFFPSAAAAQRAGFRACKRCRPDATPGSPAWDSRADVVARAMRLIADGVVDREGVPSLAHHLGYSVRQLERLLLAEVGAGPIALARAQRAQSARVLIETTRLPMAEVAFAAGFASIRQFNDTVRAVFATSPTGLRAGATRRGGPGTGEGATLDLRLPHRVPLSPTSLFGHLAATAVPGVEEVRDGAYRRTLRLTHGTGIVALAPADGSIACRVRLADLRDLTAAIARCRWLLDLDADPVAVDDLLTRDPLLRPLVAAAPGRRVPRCVDAAELAVRAVLGQQVSTAAARTTAGRLAAVHGRPVDDPAGGLTRLFPEPASLVGTGVPLSGGRRRALHGLASALADGRLDLGPGCDRDAARADLAALPGLGPWTVEMVAMRALGDPDAFPATDLGVRNAARTLGLPGDARALVERSGAWRPWRAYAVQHLWASTDHPINRWPPTGEAPSDQPLEGAA
jgi:AraC family transcriptional regulator of adaptative response / DNA-3-methyladenine glycosylase II